tara:strand:- start:468 stop:659 length:192 start_codon:yes stop_codon:yes gene_type:complete
MSKSKTDYKKETKKLESPTIAETIETMKAQLETYKQQAEYYKTMALKAQGAIEVLTQLEEKNK